MWKTSKCIRGVTSSSLSTVWLLVGGVLLLGACPSSQTVPKTTVSSESNAMASGSPRASATSASHDNAGWNGLCPKPEARQFDFWHGEWNVINRQTNPRDPTNPTLYPTGVANKLGYSVVGGCLNVEHWQGLLSWGRILGINLRWYDTDRREWLLVAAWPLAGSPRFTSMRGSFERGEGRLESSRQNAQGQRVRSLFVISDMDKPSPRWESRISVGDDGPWTTTWVMEFHKRSRTQFAPLFVGPVQGEISKRRCDQAEARTFDFLVGEWRDESQRTDQLAIRGYSILDGCAVMDVSEVVNASTTGQKDVLPTQGFRVRLYDATLKKWVQYGLDAAYPRLRRLEGGVNGDSLVLTSVDHRERGWPALRETWKAEEPGKMSWQREMSTDAGATWRVTKTAVLTHRGGG